MTILMKLTRTNQTLKKGGRVKNMAVENPRTMSEEQLRGVMGEGVVDNLDPGLSRAFQFADQVVPAELRNPEKLRMKPGHLKISGDGIFYTLQGEGPTMGEPTSFLRLQICNLACGQCFAKGSKVLTPQGEIDISDIKEGDEVISYIDKRYVVAKILRIEQRKSQVVKFITEEGMHTIVTPEHIYYVDHHLSRGKRGLRRGQSRRCRAQFLRDKYVLKAVGVPFEYPLGFKNLAERVGYIKGAMLGDGCISKQGKYSHLYLQVCDLDFAEVIRDILNKDFKHRANITTSKRDGRRLVYRLSVSGNVTASIISAEPKGEDEVRGYIAGFFDAEGHTAKNQLILSQKDVRVLTSIQNLLTTLGFKSAYEKRNKADAIVINSKAQIEKFFKLFPVQLKRKIDKFVNTSKTNVSVRVVNVEPHEALEVYSLKATSGNMFINRYLVEDCS